MGNPCAIPNVKYLVRVYKPDVLFLCETISNSNKTAELKYVLGFEYCFTINRQGLSGGLALYWNSCVNFSISNFSNNHIDVKVSDNVKCDWRLTNYYAFPGSGRRIEAWNFLRQLTIVYDLPWCIIGDFNDIIEGEKNTRKVG